MPDYRLLDDDKIADICDSIETELPMNEKAFSIVGCDMVGNLPLWPTGNMLSTRDVSTTLQRGHFNMGVIMVDVVDRSRWEVMKPTGRPQIMQVLYCRATGKVKRGHSQGLVGGVREDYFSD